MTRPIPVPVAAFLATTCLAGVAFAQEPAACRSPNPADWPAPARPYFMLAVDTSGSMTTCAPGDNPTDCNSASGTTSSCEGQTNSCGLPLTRIDGARCALTQTLQAYGGLANFGLAGFGGLVSNCNQANCQPCNDGVRCDCRTSAGGGFDDYDDNGDVHGCNLTPLPDAGLAYPTQKGCGNVPTSCSTGATFNGPVGTGFRNGGNILVPLQVDPAPVAGQSNIAELLQWFDARPGQANGCLANREIWANGHTPLEGILRTVHHYLVDGWDPRWGQTNYCASNPFGGQYPLFPAPLTSSEPACRSINVILVTDGAETCSGNGVNAATALLAAGIRTYVINFIGGVQAATDAIAAAGGTTASFFANNEVQLATALSNIVAGAIRPELCNNLDDNCNGCTDEGSQIYCHKNKTAVGNPTQVGQCCNWTNQAQRDACFTRWQATVTVANPTGDTFELPCWTPGSQPGGFTSETSWLCVDPGEVCNNLDDNCDAVCAASSPFACGYDPVPPTPNAVDEGFTKCGSPLACPTAETCDGQDQDCDGIVDNAPGSAIPFSVPSVPSCTPCVPSAEICDGCDNDCDFIADDGVAALPCGFSQGAPCNDICAGTQTCGAQAAVPTRNGCLPGFPASRFGACSATGGTEVCNGCDDDCDNQIDEGIPPTPCDVPVPPAPPGVPLNYGPNSQCRRGMLPCNGTCTGWIGPSIEVCDGIDNDCDGTVDDSVPGVGNPCGTATGQCQKGTTVCIGVGGIICQGGVPPANEVCNGLDDDCDGATDDAPLMDAPTNPNCWELPGGTCTPACSHAGFAWCPPPGGTCTGLGTLATPPCTTGTLDCNGTSGWRCVDSEGPVPEVCDGVDNDCDGTPDEMLGAPIGDQCGTDVGECEFGAQVCDMGVIDCLGGVGPKPEECNGLDDDCDGVLDNGIPLGGPCPAPYDTAAYPGDRTQGQCRPGNLECDMNGGLICVNGIGPSPEICDGLDNDCDGDTDESGMAPDGIDGTADPLDMTRHIGDPCGTDVGECQEGILGCVNGQVVCLNSVGEQPEKCDCADNDCNGIVDNMNDTGEPSLCSPGKDCVDVGDACFCAAPCAPTEFPCPTGTTCESVIISETQMPAPADYCIPEDPCGDCSTRTVTDAQGVVCAPDGTAGPFVPVCVCKGQDGCQNPCFGAPPCGPGLACVDVGPSAGTCQGADNCYFFGCPDGEACRGGVCVEDPCEPNTCTAPTPVCKPTAAFDAECTGSCAGVDCDPGKACEGGACVDTGCGVDCATGEVCKPAGDGGFACGPDECVSADGGVPCPDGRHCDPVDGSCDDDPCTAVHCPATEVCKDGECVEGPTGTGGAGGTAGGAGGAAAGGSSGAGNTDASSGGTSGASGSGPAKTRGVFGLATGGGGCACRTRTDAPDHGALGALALMSAATWRRRRRD